MVDGDTGGTTACERPAIRVVGAARRRERHGIAGGKPVFCREPRDIAPDTSADFGFEPPAGLRVVEEEPPERPPNPAGFAAKAAADAMRDVSGSLRRTGR